MVTGALKPPQQDERSDDDGDEDEEWRGIQPIAFVPFRQQSCIFVREPKGTAVFKTKLTQTLGPSGSQSKEKGVCHERRHRDS